MSVDLKSRRISKSNTIGSKFDLFRRTLDYDESIKSSDDEFDDFDVDQNYVFEIGPPKILKRISEIRPELNEITILDQEPKKFFELELKDLLNGGIQCDFCLSIAHKWSTINEAYCCKDYKEYVQGLVDCQKYVESLQDNLRFDYKTSTFVTKVHKTAIIFRRKLNQIRKLSRFYQYNPQKKISLLDSKKEEKLEVNISKNLGELEEKFQQILTDRQPDSISNGSYDSQDVKSKNRINYLLSNFKYVDRGWTILNTDYDSNLYTKKAIDLKGGLDDPATIDIWSSHFTRPIIKNYKNGKAFQIIHSDRTGNIYYPNGKLALLISNSGNYRFFIAFSSDETPITLASFDSQGNAFCNYNNGKLRYQININGGINFDQFGNCVRKWLFPVDSSKTLTFHPIRFSINEYMSVQIHNKFKIVFQFRSRHGCCKFLIKLNNPMSNKSTKLVRKSTFYNNSFNITGTNNTNSNSNTIRKANSNLKFPPLQFHIGEQLSNKESYTYSISKSTFLDNTSSISNTTRSSNRLTDKNTINNSIIFSLQNSVKS